MYADLKARLERNLAERENAATNPAVAKISVAVTNPPATVEIAPTNFESFSTNAAIAQAMGTAASNIIAGLPTNSMVVTTNISVAPTNAIVPTNMLPIFTNEVPALTNPPPFSTNIAPVLTNVPPSPPKPLQMQMPPPFLRLLPQTPSTNAP
jgi:hypothetical protein